MEPSQRSLVTVSGEPVQIVGVATLRTILDGHPVVHQFEVVILDEEGVDMVLGMDLLECLGLQIDYRTKTAVWPQKKPLSEDAGAGDVLTAEAGEALVNCDENDADEHYGQDLQDMEVLDYVPRGMDEEFPC